MNDMHSSHNEYVCTAFVVSTLKRHTNQNSNILTQHTAGLHFINKTNAGSHNTAKTRTGKGILLLPKANPE